ncbi:uncharacterized protein LOC130999662 [Salvia miltiorrhiza]|uniref:uncharacterized protein LOC130999662 n=1 Tax=Salvia miltiorrhiza TaxID=226208 RepID=UPI0025ACBB11|nr:uncharacterized protein LOC130999662 [Salvia miltiorrhiza]XP_057781247.1 uncharacterized protein LOC130999662 [Salvia miltiorrhiza]
MMEAQKKGLSLKQKMKSEKRSPLLNLSAVQFHKSNTKIASNSSSAAAPASAEPRNLRFLISSNSSSDASSSSRARLGRKPRSLPKSGSNFSAKSVRSKENELPRKPYSEKPKKKTDSISKAAQTSKISCGRGNSVKVLKKNLEKLGETPLFKSSTPVVSSGVRRNAAEESNGGNGSAASAKTPPVEVSVSPEIQSKMVVSKSAATPVCYGAGHLLSGVTDKRKCRRRGSLRGGFEKVNLFDDEENDKKVVDDLQDPLIPLPSEASVRWLLSPCNEGGEDRGSDLEINKVEECEMSCGNASLALDLMSSPSTLCELGCLDSDFRGSGSVDGAENLGKVGIFMLSRQENSYFLENSDEKMRDPLSAATPNSVSNFLSVSLGEGDSSAVSLSSGNIIQTPSSECSSYECIRRSNVEEYQRSFVQFELDSVTETLDSVRLDSSSRSSVPVQLEKNVDSVCSWESSSTLENLTLSQMRISWRDGLEWCRIDERDEFDCCPCLSDEEIDAFGCSDQQLKPRRDEEKNHREKDPCMDKDVSPILLEYEPCIRAAPKEKAAGDGPDACAESICTNGGDLAVSCDSDWADIRENRSFHVK